MKEVFNKGSELDKQIYSEGEGTWGLKEGFLDVEDVREFIRRRIIDIEQEQKRANTKDWKRGLKLLKTNLERDMGEKLIWH